MRIGLLLLSFFLSSSVWAINGKVLHLKLVNDSSETLTFKRLTGENSGNEFYIEHTTLAPGAETDITGIITADNDLAGMLHFENSQGDQHTLWVKDPRKFHITSAEFNMRNEKIISRVESKRFNSHGSPRDLWVKEAKVRLVDVNSTDKLA